MEDQPSDNWGPIEVFIRYWAAGIGATAIVIAGALLKADIEVPFREVAIEFGKGVALSLLVAAAYCAARTFFRKPRSGQREL